MKRCPFCKHEVKPIVIHGAELCPNCRQTICQGCGGTNPDEPADFETWRDQTMGPFASICVLAYNRPQFLRDVIGSITQAGAPYELIVHDDGSTDPRQLEYLARLQQEGIISTLILNPPGHNQGQGIALNRMFAIAKGDPIIKCDHDLIYEPGWLAKVNEILVKNRMKAPNRIDAQEARIGLLGFFHYHHDPVDSAKTKLNQFDGWQQHTHICGSCFALRRETWNALGPFEEHSEAFAEDWVMQNKVHESGMWVCGLPDEDLCRNQGFGVGPSTVVVKENTVASIHRGPFVFEPAVEAIG